MSSATPAEGLTRHKVVHTALDLLDQVGLDGLTTRRLATELGVKSPALYWHFRNKQELLDEMAATLLLEAGMGGPRPDEPWRDWLSRRAHTYRRSVLGRRDGGRLVIGVDPGPVVAARFDEELAALTERGFTPLLALRSITAVALYTIGFVLQEQASRPSPPSWTPPAGGLPTLTAAVTAGGSHPDAAFEQSLALVLDGIAARLQHP